MFKLRNFNILRMQTVNNSEIFSGMFWFFIGYTQSEIRELKGLIETYGYAIFPTVCSIVYKFCTRPISKHLYSGIFKNPLVMKHKIFKNRLNSLCFMLKIGVVKIDP